MTDTTATSVPSTLFTSVVRQDYDALWRLFAVRCRDAIVRNVAQQQQLRASAAAENSFGGGRFFMQTQYDDVKVDEALSQLTGSASSSSSKFGAGGLLSSVVGTCKTTREDNSYLYLLRELSLLLHDGQSDSTVAAATVISRSSSDASDSSSNSRDACHSPTTATDSLHEVFSTTSSTVRRVMMSPEAERLVRDAVARLADRRPPANFVVYDRHTILEEPMPTINLNSNRVAAAAAAMQVDGEDNEPLPPAPSSPPPPSPPPPPAPLFDGSVANATPPPLGAAGGMGGTVTPPPPSGGAGTVLHLCCALDDPLALALLLALQADARACHTAFRRLMIHEAACNGALQCLQLLLELGACYEAQVMQQQQQHAPMVSPPRFRQRGHHHTELPFTPRRMDRYHADYQYSFLHGSTTDFAANMVVGGGGNVARGAVALYKERFEKPATQSQPSSSESFDLLHILRLFRSLVPRVQAGQMSHLDAARQIMAAAALTEVSKLSLARSCGFSNSGIGQRYHYNGVPLPHHMPSFMRPYGSHSDGHGNTPLHWAAFKNETACVSMLLHYQADPNSRAHPSGWTPLHDAAYSDSKECIELLLNAGAHVDARANSGATPLCFAAQEDSAAAAQLLLDRGADLRIRCAGGPAMSPPSRHPDDGAVPPPPPPPPNNAYSRFSGYTPLHYCAHYNAKKAAQVLLTHPAAAAAMEIPDLSERLPIHVAVARGSSDVLRELLMAGARVETRASKEAAAAAAEANSLSYHRRFIQQQAGLVLPLTPRRQPPSPEDAPSTPNNNRRFRRSGSSTASSNTPVSSPLLRSMIPSQPVASSKPWNCLTQRSIDECKLLISEAEGPWAPERHRLFTPDDRKAVIELLKVGKRLERNGTGVFIDLWPQVLRFCGRGWFETDGGAHEISMDMEDADENDDAMQVTGIVMDASEYGDEGSDLSLPSL